MSVIGSPVETSLLQAAQAQQSASKARDRERATDRGRRLQDLVELRVAGLEASEAIRAVPDNASQEAEYEHQADGDDRPDEAGHIDVTA